MLVNTLLILFAYLLGSVASAIIVCKLMGLDDPRLHGSNNPGASNVLRLHGKKAAAFTLSGDVIKGVFPVAFAKALAAPDLIIALTGFAAFSGHLFPVYFKFRGGKGVATLTGVLFGMHWLLGLSFIMTWMFVAALFRYSSLSALVAAALTPVYTFFILQSPVYAICNGLMAGILFWRHRTNIQNLIAGSEKKIEKQ
jgi:glycerol-3-phosphate acyltransferase PlsY